jgi:hypothetical protein
MRIGFSISSLHLGRPPQQVTETRLALMVALPVATRVANPVALTVATAVLDDDQTGALQTAVVSFEYVAMNYCVVADAAEVDAGVTMMLDWVVDGVTAEFVKVDDTIDDGA